MYGSCDVLIVRLQINVYPNWTSQAQQVAYQTCHYSVMSLIPMISTEPHKPPGNNIVYPMLAFCYYAVERNPFISSSKKLKVSYSIYSQRYTCVYYISN